MSITFPLWPVDDDASFTELLGPVPVGLPNHEEEPLHVTPRRYPDDDFSTVVSMSVVLVLTALVCVQGAAKCSAVLECHLVVSVWAVTR